MDVTTAPIAGTAASITDVRSVTNENRGELVILDDSGPLVRVLDPRDGKVRFIGRPYRDQGEANT